MGTCCSVPSVEEAESAQHFRQVDANQDKVIEHHEMEKYVKNHAEMWAMLSVNLGQSEDACQQTATRVAMELASGLQGPAALQAELTEAQFHAFRCKYMVDGKGAQEFFQRCVFTSFAKDNTSLSDRQLDAFLDTFYKTGSIFEGDKRLPPKGELKARITKNNSSGQLTFEQIRDVIRGTTGDVMVSNGNNTAAAAPPVGNGSSADGSLLKDFPPNNNVTLPQGTPPLSFSAAPEETPEPKSTSNNLAPPSVELGLNSDPEQTPEVQPLPPPSPPKKTRQRKSSNKTNTGERRTSRSQSPSAQRNKPTTSNGRSRSPSKRKSRSTATRSKSPSQRKQRAQSADDPKKSSAKKTLTRYPSRSGRSASPSQRKMRRSKSTASSDGSPTQQQKKRSKPRTTTANAPTQKATKTKKQ